MSTRAIYTFKDETDEIHIYVHYDGYPEGAAIKFKKTLESGKIWPLPRFEADEFAAGFVAANKDDAGNIRIANSRHAFDDIEYAYTIYMKDDKLMVEANSIIGDSDDGKSFIEETFRKNTMEDFLCIYLRE